MNRHSRQPNDTSIANKTIIKINVFHLPPNQFGSFPTASIYNIFLILVLNKAGNKNTVIFNNGTNFLNNSADFGFHTLACWIKLINFQASPLPSLAFKAGFTSKLPCSQYFDCLRGSFVQLASTCNLT